MPASKSPIFNFKNRGQALLLVLFAMAVILTASLAPLSRTVSDIAITETGEEASRAFSAAEAGIEKALLVGESGSFEIGDATVFTRVGQIPLNQPSFAYPDTQLLAGQMANLWLVDHDADGNLVPNCDDPGNYCIDPGTPIRVCWGEGSYADNQIPAIEVSIIHIPLASGTFNFSDTRVTRWTFDGNTIRGEENSFNEDHGSHRCDTGREHLYNSRTDVRLPASRRSLLLQVKLYYNTTSPAPVAFQVTDDQFLPGQGQMVESQAKVSDSTQTIRVFRTLSFPHSWFGSVTASPISGSITAP